MRDERMSLQEYRREMGLGDHVTDVARGSGDGALKSGKAPRSRPEESLQLACLELAATHRLEAKGRCLIVHVANEKGGRSYAEMAVRKALGVRAGCADLLILMPGGRLACAELKAPKGRQTPAQHKFEIDCRSFGTPYRIVKTPEQFEEYLVELGCVMDDERLLTEGGGE